MPVVNKCLSEDNQESEKYFDLTQDIYDSLQSIDIKSLYLAVIDFINWYNSVQNPREEN